MPERQPADEVDQGEQHNAEKRRQEQAGEDFIDSVLLA